MRDILDTLSEGVVVVSHPERSIQFLNQAARELLGYEEGDNLSGRCKEITKGSLCETACPLTAAISHGKDVRNVPTVYQTAKGGVLRCRTHIHLLRDEDGEVCAGVEIFDEIYGMEAAIWEEDRNSFPAIVGQSQAISQLFGQIQKVGRTHTTVLITGESGTGKELVANGLHLVSPRRSRPLVRVHCAALNPGVLESELFGHVRGGFTGAVTDKVGRFELANGGTLFLDEVGEIPLTTQVKLLRVLQDGELERVGSGTSLHVDVRLITATNRNLEKMVEEGTFRLDLFYRINVVNISIPPLRERKEDIPPLVHHFMKKLKPRMPHLSLEGISPEAMRILSAYPYPGNVRELENVIEHAMVQCEGNILTPQDFPERVTARRLPIMSPLSPTSIHPASYSPPPVGARNVTREVILAALKGNDWRMERTAESLGISRITLWRRMKAMEIQKPEKSED